jgi:PAS domain S-box-containing protein
VKNSAKIPSDISKRLETRSAGELFLDDRPRIQSQMLLVMLIALSVFICEASVMFVISFLPTFSIWLGALINATLLVILLSPVLYFCLFRKLVRHIYKRRQVETELENHRDHLDELVVERTGELTAANKKLTKEIMGHQRTTNALRESEKTYRLLVDNLQEGIWFIDKDAYTTFANPRMTEMLGYTFDEMQGKHLYTFMDDRGIEISKQNLERRNQGIREPHDFELLKKDGNRIFVSMETAPITNDDGDYIGALASVADINARRQTDLELQKRTHDLGERVKELNCFYGISHLVEKHGNSLKNVIQGTLELIPFSWQYPQITCARIVVEAQEFKTENFKETEWKQTSNIIEKGEPIGFLEVFYLGKRPAMDEGPFLKEERNLIDAIASRLGRIIERVKAEEELQQESNVDAALSALYSPLISPSATVENIAATVLEKAKSLTYSEHGYVSSIDPATGDNVSHTLTAMLEDQCSVMPEQEIIFPRREDGSYKSLWGHALNTIEPFFTNSPQDHISRAGVPRGHIPIERFLSVPVMLGEELVGQIALANKAGDYTKKDLEAIGRVAEFYALAIQRNRAGAELQNAKNELENRVEVRTAELFEANKQLRAEIKDRNRFEEQLLQSKSRLQAVFDSISEPLILLSKDMVVKMLNRTAAGYYGLSEYKELLDSKCHQMLGESAEPCEGCEIPAAISTDKSMMLERKGFMDPDRLEQIFIYPVKGEGDDSRDLLLRISDITEQRMFEKQLIHSEKMSSLGVLVSSIAHEINNPNSFISFNIPILRDYMEEVMPIVDGYAADHRDLEICHMAYPEFRKDIANLLDNIEHGSGRINRFVSNLKEFSQVKDKVEERWFEVTPLIERVLSICNLQRNKNVKSFVTNIPENLRRIWSDPFFLEQILLNLLVNAAQAVDKNDSRIDLNVEIRPSWLDHAILEVKDNGIGMDEKTVQEIFNPFFTTKSGTGGTGLGLYVSHNLVQSLGGRIEVESESGNGSTFRVILPDKERRSRKRP